MLPTECALGRAERYRQLAPARLRRTVRNFILVAAVTIFVASHFRSITPVTKKSSDLRRRLLSQTWNGADASRHPPGMLPS